MVQRLKYNYSQTKSNELEFSVSALESPAHEESVHLDDSICSAEVDTSPLDESSSLLDHDSMDEGKSPSLEDQRFNDIGTKHNSTMSVDVICPVVSNLS